jgi:hypothetical protein
MPRPPAVKFKKKKSQGTEAVPVTLVLTTPAEDHPQWVADAFANGTFTIEAGVLVVLTGQGPQAAVAGDVLVNIIGTGGPTLMKQETFNALYEPE